MTDKPTDKRIGNQFWKVRSKHGRDKIFETPEILWEAACEYFEWVVDNPLQKAIIYQGEVSKESEDLMRPMTIGGLCIFLDVHAEYLAGFESDLDLETKEGKDFSQIVKAIKQIIYEQKFAGATAGLMNPNIIARDLGLKDKSSSELTGPNGGPIETKVSWSILPVTPINNIDE